MASAELQRLWKLSQVDAALTDIRHRAANLDVGQKIRAEIDRLQKEEETVGGNARKLSGDLADLELTQKGIDDKLKRIDKELYGGKVVNPREVENLEKEIAALKKQKSANDDKILELWDTVPPAKEAAAKIEKEIAIRQKQLADRKKAAVGERTNLETEYARLTKLRPDAAKGVTPGLMAKYDSVRQRLNGYGMAEVTRKQTCGHCGTVLPERTVQALKDEKVITCESCHIILYYTEGVV